MIIQLPVEPIRDFGTADARALPVSYAILCDACLMHLYGTKAGL